MPDKLSTNEEGNKGPNEFLFDISKQEATAIQNYKNIEQAKSNINKYMKRIGELSNIVENQHLQQV